MHSETTTRWQRLTDQYWVDHSHRHIKIWSFILRHLSLPAGISVQEKYISILDLHNIQYIDLYTYEELQKVINKEGLMKTCWHTEGANEV